LTTGVQKGELDMIRISHQMLLVMLQSVYVNPIASTRGEKKRIAGV